ncbi:DNA/RNA non-specific endonuclease [Mucilaginibacter celer]|nr:DNA/RNA non-specific endonuclease [Mucilaginibacter celer]
MNMIRTFLLLSVLTLSAWHKPQTDELREDFGKGSKTAYAPGAVTFSSGTWYLADALTDKNAVRIRNNGRLSMTFDFNGEARTLEVSYAAYGTDENSGFQVWYSTDQGKSYRQTGTLRSTQGSTKRSTTFSTNIKGPVRFELRKVSGGKNRILISKFAINAHAQTSAQASSSTLPLKGNYNYDNSNLLLGNPSHANTDLNTPDNYLIDRSYYISSYNKSRGCPNWVSWHIGKNDFGSADRQNDFRADATLPAGWYHVDDTDYKNSGFDKGHNCPSADRTSTTAANSATFLMDNMMPQAPNNNQKTWEHLEAYCRDQVKAGMEVYVIAGSYGSGGYGRNGYFKTIAGGKVTVPSNIWKVVVIIPEGDHDLQRINTKTRVIAVNTPNDNIITPNWMNYTCTVRDIEKATGYDLLSALPKPVQDVVETVKFKGGN